MGQSYVLPMTWVLKIHKWISGDVYELGKVSQAMTSDT